MGWWWHREPSSLPDAPGGQCFMPSPSIVVWKFVSWMLWLFRITVNSRQWYKIDNITWGSLVDSQNENWYFKRSEEKKRSEKRDSASTIFERDQGSGRSVVIQSCPTLWDPMDYIAHQAPLSMEFFKQEHWSGLPFPSPGDLPDPGIEPGSAAFQADSLLSEPQW